MGNIEIRRFRNEDSQAVSHLIRRNFIEVNVKDYSFEEMDKLASIYDSNKVLEISSFAHMYVVCEDHQIVGCGSIASYWGKIDESVLLTIFVQPELHGKGIGKIIMETLEADELFKRAIRIEIPSSITACDFY